jgi:hypothetical protein
MTENAPIVGFPLKPRGDTCDGERAEAVNRKGAAVSTENGTAYTLAQTSDHRLSTGMLKDPYPPRLLKKVQMQGGPQRAE